MSGPQGQVPERQSAVAQEFCLNLQEVGLDRGGSAKPPKLQCEAKHKLAFDRGSCIVISSDGCFESLVILGVFHTCHDRFGCELVLRALARECCLPSSVLGPVLRSALRRLASNWRNEVIGRIRLDGRNFGRYRAAVGNVSQLAHRFFGARMTFLLKRIAVFRDAACLLPEL